jgi:hypothetical protein
MANVPTIDPLKYTIDALIAQGSPEAFSQASKLAKQAAASAPPPAPTKPDPERRMSYSELRALTVGEMTTLQIEEPQVVKRSLEALRAAGSKHNVDANQGKK